MAHPSGNIAIKNLKHRKEPHFHCCSQPGAASMCSSTMHYLAHAIKVQVLIRVGYHQGKPPSSEGWLNPMLHCLNEVVWTAGIGMSQHSIVVVLHLSFLAGMLKQTERQQITKGRQSRITASRILATQLVSQLQGCGRCQPKVRPETRGH